MGVHPWKDVRDKKIAPDKRAATHGWVRQKVLEIGLLDLCERKRMIRAELARLIETSQAEAAQAQQHDHIRDIPISTLRSIIEGLGGKLEVTAVFDDERVSLNV